MNRSIRWAFSCSLVLLLAGGCVLVPDEVGKVREGSGLVRMSSQKTWKEAQENSVLYRSDFLSTGEGSRLRFTVDGNEFEMYENTSVFIADRNPDGMRRLCMEKGDLVLSIAPSDRSALVLETAAGKVLCRQGLLFVRMVERPGQGLSRSRGGTEMQMNLAVISGQAVIEHSGLGRKIREGHFCYVETGAPPSPPAPIDPKLLEETRESLKKEFGGISTFNLERSSDTAEPGRRPSRMESGENPGNGREGSEPEKGGK